MTRSSLLLQMMMMAMLMMKNSGSSFPSASADAITVRSGEAVRLSADLTVAERTRLVELQWQHPSGRLTRKKNVTRGDGIVRCQLLSDGSLSFDRTQTEDSGKYLMRAFDAEGKGIKTKAINLLVIADKSQPGGPSASTIAAACLAVCCFLLLTFILSYSIIERRRRRKRGVTAGKATR